MLCFLTFLWLLFGFIIHKIDYSPICFFIFNRVIMEIFNFPVLDRRMSWYPKLLLWSFGNRVLRLSWMMLIRNWCEFPVGYFTSAHSFSWFTFSLNAIRRWRMILMLSKDMFRLFYTLLTSTIIEWTIHLARMWALSVLSINFLLFLFDWL